MAAHNDGSLSSTCLGILSLGPILPAQKARDQLLTVEPIQSRDDLNSRDLYDDNGMTQSKALKLYACHLLFTWNSRTYEFAAIIFTASAYPHTLAASSVRGIAATLALIFLSSTLGRWIDRTPNRLRCLWTTISVNRLSVIVLCILWSFIVTGQDNAVANLGDRVKYLIFALIVVIGMLEKLSVSADITAMERDWVVTIADPARSSYNLTHLNSIMRRIDLVCKLTAPMFISFAIGWVKSTRSGVFIVGASSATSFGIELWCARRLWASDAKLRKLKDAFELCLPPGDPSHRGRKFRIRRAGFFENISGSIKILQQDFRLYFSSCVWIPSLALCQLYLSVLAYSATFVTYLLAVGFSLNLITLARAAGALVEISSTVITPLGVQYLGITVDRNVTDATMDEEWDGSWTEEQAMSLNSTQTGLERVGLWGITWHLINLIPVAFVLWNLSFISPHLTRNGQSSRFGIPTTTLGTPLLLAIILFMFLSLSRLGLSVFSLTTQQLCQTLIPPHQTSSFAGVETSLINVFEFCQNVAAIIWNRPEQFKYLALGSLGAVTTSTVMYVAWLIKNRNDLHRRRVKQAENLPMEGLRVGAVGKSVAHAQKHLNHSAINGGSSQMQQSRFMMPLEISETIWD